METMNVINLAKKKKYSLLIEEIEVKQDFNRFLRRWVKFGQGIYIYKLMSI